MKKKLIYFIVVLCCFGNAFTINAQNIGINSNSAAPDNSAMLDIASPDKGLLIPRMDSTSRKNIVAPAIGLMVYDSTYHSFYYHNGTDWMAISGGGDDLGNHMANQNLQLKDHWLNNDGDANEGIYVDTLGNVGIGEKSSSTFHVKIADQIVSQLMVNNNLLSFSFSGSPSLFQTFTANATDSITNIAISFRDVNGPTGTGEDKVFDIYEGIGTGGNLLFTSAPVFVPRFAGAATFDFPVSGVGVVDGQVYSIYFADGEGVGFNDDGYAGGTLDLGSNIDMAFSITSFHIDENSGLSVSDAGIELNNYTIPLADGSPGQILATDGSGNVNWTNPVDTDNQQLTIANDSLFLTNSTAVDLDPYLDNTDNQELTISNDSIFLTNSAAIDLDPYLDNTDGQQLTISNDSLFLSNDPTPINLSPYLDADNLGNHTATQNILLGSNSVQNNAVTVGLTMGILNELNLESNFQRIAHFKSNLVSGLGATAGGYIEMNNKAGTRALIGADGAGFYSATDTFNMIVGNWTSLGTMSFHVNAGVKVMSLDALGRMGIGRTPVTNLLEVEGNASKTTAGNWLANSDARLKKNITALSSENILDKMLSLQGVTYEWNDTQTDTKRPEGIQYGFTAQNIQEVFPSLVTEDNNGFLQTPYGTYDAMTVEAIRALNDKIEILATENAILKSKNQQLETNIAELSNLKNAFAKLEALVKKNDSTISEGSIESKK